MNNAIYFGLGLVIGAASSWYFTKKFYEKKADDEIEGYREKLKEKAFVDKEDKEAEKKDKATYIDIARNYAKPDHVTDYVARYKKDVTVVSDVTEHPVDDDEDEPVVISPDEFGEIPDYDKVSLTYYADGFLVENDTNEIVEDVSDVIGNEALDSFGEYETDSVHVRNDDRQTYYEILLSEQDYRIEN